MIFGPVAVTAYIAWWVIDTVDNWVKPIVPSILWPDSYLPFHVPGFGVVIVVTGLTLLGFLAANLAGRTLVAMGEAMVDRTPLVRAIYKSVKQIFETLFSQSGSHFRKVGLVEFPMKGSWSVVFISADPVSVVADALPARRHDVGVPALHAQSDHRLLFLRADGRRHRIADHAGRGRQADHVGRADPTGGPGDARRARGGREEARLTR